MGGSVKEWVQDWDDQINQWVQALPTDGDEASGQEAIQRAADTIMDPETRSCYTGAGDTAIVYHAMPEPYIGNPFAAIRGEQPLHGVILTLNPGQVVYSHQALYNKESKYAPGEYIRRVRNGAGYNELVRDSTRVPKETHKFWSSKAFRFIDRVTGDKIGHTAIENAVGIDLWPWHSKSWGNLEKDPAVKDWAKKRVLPAVFQLARASRLSKIYNQSRTGPDYGLFLSIGKDNRRILSQLDFELKWCIDPHMKNAQNQKVTNWVPDFVQNQYNWPKNGHRHKNVSFFWLEHKHLGLSALVAQVMFNSAPGEGFRDFLQALISDPSLQEKLRNWYADNKNKAWERTLNG
jgi:hypothetical protein